MNFNGNAWGDKGKVVELLQSIINNISKIKCNFDKK